MCIITLWEVMNIFVFRHVLSLTVLLVFLVLNYIVSFFYKANFALVLIFYGKVNDYDSPEHILRLLIMLIRLGKPCRCCHSSHMSSERSAYFSCFPSDALIHK